MPSLHIFKKHLAERAPKKVIPDQAASDFIELLPNVMTPGAVECRIEWTDSGGAMVLMPIPVPRRSRYHTRSSNRAIRVLNVRRVSSMRPPSRAAWYESAVRRPSGPRSMNCRSCAATCVGRFSRPRRRRRWERKSMTPNRRLWIRSPRSSRQWFATPLRAGSFITTIPR